MADKQISAFLSQKVYENLLEESSFGLPGGPSDRFVVKQTWTVPTTGYYGAVIYDTVTNEAILVNRGTELTDINDLTADLDIVFGGPGGGQFQSAQDFLTAYNSTHGSEPDYMPVTTTTGHSLGAYIAKGLGIVHDFFVQAFASPGGAGLLDDLVTAGYSSEVGSFNYGKISSTIGVNDPVSNFGSQIPGINVQSINFDQANGSGLDSAIINMSEKLGYLDEAVITLINPFLKWRYP